MRLARTAKRCGILPERMRRIEIAVLTNDATRKHQVFEFVAIKRGDTGLWAMPGGMVDDVKDTFQATAVREFFEEAAAGNKELEERLRPIMLREGEVRYAGLIDDTRSTDNTWTESVLFHFHYDPKIHKELPLQFADDAIGAEWIRTDSERFRGVKTFHSHHRMLVLGALGLPLRGASILEFERKDWPDEEPMARKMNE